MKILKNYIKKNLEQITQIIFQYKDDEQDNVNIENNEDYSQEIKYIKDISNILEIEIQEKINQSKIMKQMKLIMMIQ